MKQDLAMTLPASWYTSKAIGALEKRAVFFKSWILLGAVTKFPEAGVDYKHELCQVDFTVRRSSEDWHSIKITRDSDGTDVRTHLTKTGLVFLTLSDETVPFADFFPGFEDKIAHADFTELGLQRPLTYQSSNNWKATVDAYQECLHCSYAHPEFAKTFAPSGYNVVEMHNYSQHMAGASTGADGLFFYLFPNCTLSLYAGGLTCWRINPVEGDPTKARMEFDYYHKAPAGSAEFEEWYRFARNVAVEDIELCERAQTNFDVGIYSTGVLNPNKENGVAYFHGRVLELCHDLYQKEITMIHS